MVSSSADPTENQHLTLQLHDVFRSLFWIPCRELLRPAGSHCPTHSHLISHKFNVQRQPQMKWQGAEIKRKWRKCKRRKGVCTCQILKQHLKPSPPHLFNIRISETNSMTITPISDSGQEKTCKIWSWLSYFTLLVTASVTFCVYSWVQHHGILWEEQRLSRHSCCYSHL